MISKFQDGEEEHQINHKDDSLEDQNHHFDKEITDAKKRRKLKERPSKKGDVRVESKTDSNPDRTQNHHQRYHQFSESKSFSYGNSVFVVNADIFDNIIQDIKYAIFTHEFSNILTLLISIRRMKIGLE